MKKTTIALGPHSEAFVQESVATKRAKALSELDLALAEGEASGFVSLFREELIGKIEEVNDTALRTSAE